MRRLALFVGFALLVLGSLARGAEVRDCRDETPLPADVRLIVPGADVSPDAARFAGAWVGPWKTATGDIVCGTLVGELRGGLDVGRWEVADDGEYCLTWNVSDGARRRCHRVYQTAEGLELYSVDRWTATRMRRVFTP